MDRVLGVILRFLGLIDRVLVLANNLVNEFLRPVVIELVNGIVHGIASMWHGLIVLFSSLSDAVREVWAHSSTSNIGRLVFVGFLFFTMPSTAATILAIRKMLERNFTRWTGTSSSETDHGLDIHAALPRTESA